MWGYNGAGDPVLPEVFRRNAKKVFVTRNQKIGLDFLA
jgi:hypothetical protein